MNPVVRRILEHPLLGPKVAHHRRLDGSEPRYAATERPLPREIEEAHRALGAERLYAHQAAALDAARAGENVLVATPTASGKSLVFALPAIEAALGDPPGTSLFLYPTKALAQDQLATLRALAAATGRLRPPTFEIYDGDTPDGMRRKIKQDPPDVLITNPDMLHAGILPYHADWAPFLARLRYVVLDELHVYRGVFGAHVHHIVRRLRRLAALHGASPSFVAASATIGRADEFAASLAGVPFRLVDRSGAPSAARDVIVVNPVTVSPYTAAVRAVVAAAREGARTIAFTKARRVTELLHTWIAQEAPELRRHVAPYRAGYLPEERRAIEKKLYSGELLAVLSTSALELGIDVGGLDVCVLVGYPGSRTSTWQRIGRVGREGRDALVILIALPDALDQYLVAHPDELFDGAFERAVLDPWNPVVAGAHLVCAAAEEALTSTEVDALDPRGRDLVRDLTAAGRLAKDAEGRRYVSYRRRPQREISPRSAGAPYAILEAGRGRMLGTIDAMRVWHECHPGAIYLHAGQSYVIDALEAEHKRVIARSVRADYYTVVLGEKETEILDRLEERALPVPGGAISVGFGRLKVTVRIREYQKKRLFGGEAIATYPLDAPPLMYETTGLWIEIPPALATAFAADGLHFMGGLHAAEHAAIGLFPLLAIADRGDVGGISYTMHPQIGGPAIFLYDGVPGGAGLAERAFRDLETLLAKTREAIAACPCDAGCPACIQSPKCGNGNKPLDKAGATRLLAIVLGDEAVDLDDTSVPVPVAPPIKKHGITRAVPTPAVSGDRVLVFDLETQRSADEVGGWNHVAKMGLALAVVFDAAARCYRTYYETDVERLLLDLAFADRVIGFNIDRFDLAVLSGYTDRDLGRIRTLDLLGVIHDCVGFRVSLGHLSEVNLGESKAGDGLQSLQWWKQGRIDLIEQYCRKDVDVTRRLWEMGRAQGYLLHRDKLGRTLRIPTAWS
ncbi:MAG TPA: DEAD/DEAH box helicase [Candidatus Polarisedimenticolaceae bacterium]|nr:DEAD/DEAH box helicase [Candidatus Polarisedimenticolaceae bacterium]